MRILVVENEVGLAAVVERDLQAEGFAVDVCHDGHEGLLMAVTGSYDAIILDTMLTDANGYRVCAELRRLEIQTPILMLSAKDGALDETATLDTGADDCLSNPFSSLVLVALLDAMLRCGTRERPLMLSADDLSLDLARRCCRRGKIDIPLTPREFSLLEFLVRHVGQVVSRKEILDRVRDFAFDHSPSTVEMYISRLRRKIDSPFDRQSLQSIPGVGYRLTVA
ncbi:MAG: response regulator transcription factor [Egibacteraceae bacterium]